MKEQRRRILFIITSCLFLFGAIGTVLGSPLMQEFPTVDLVQAEARGLIEYEARGTGAASGATVKLTVTNLTGEPLNIVILPGTRFVPIELGDAYAPLSNLVLNDFEALPSFTKNPARYGDNLLSSALRPDQLGYLYYQGGQALGGAPGMSICFGSCRGGNTNNPFEHIYIAQTNETKTVTVEAFCINAELPNPTSATRFRAESPTRNALTTLSETYANRAKPPGILAMQIATWILTDDVDLEFLEKVGYTPTDTELREALLLLQEAGIDISDKKLGQIPIPPPPPPPFQAGTPTSIHVHGAVVSEDGYPITSAGVFLLVAGPENRQARFDLTNDRGRFAGTVDLYETDRVGVMVWNRGHEIGRLFYTAQELYDFFDGGSELLIVLRPIRLPILPDAETPPITETPSPEATTEADESTLPEAPAGFVVTSLDRLLYGVHLNEKAANVRAQPQTGDNIIDSLGCGDAVTLDAKTTDGAGMDWYHIQESGWVAEIVVTIYETQQHAEEVADNSDAICNPIPPTPTPGPEPIDEGGTTDGGGTGGTSGGDGGSQPPQVTTYKFKVINDTTCKVKVKIGGKGFSVDAGQSKTVNVEEGTHTLSVDGGACGSIAPHDVDISSDTELELSN